MDGSHHRQDEPACNLAHDGQAPLVPGPCHPGPAYVEQDWLERIYGDRFNGMAVWPETRDGGPQASTFRCGSTGSASARNIYFAPAPLHPYPLAWEAEEQFTAFPGGHIMLAGGGIRRTLSAATYGAWPCDPDRLRVDPQEQQRARSGLMPAHQSAQMHAVSNGISPGYASERTSPPQSVHRRMSAEMRAAPSSSSAGSLQRSAIAHSYAQSSYFQHTHPHMENPSQPYGWQPMQMGTPPGSDGLDVFRAGGPGVADGPADSWHVGPPLATDAAASMSMRVSGSGAQLHRLLLMPGCSAAAAEDGCSSPHKRGSPAETRSYGSPVRAAGSPMGVQRTPTKHTAASSLSPFTPSSSSMHVGPSPALGTVSAGGASSASAAASSSSLPSDYRRLMLTSISNLAQLRDTVARDTQLPAGDQQGLLQLIETALQQQQRQQQQQREQQQQQHEHIQTRPPSGSLELPQPQPQQQLPPHPTQRYPTPPEGASSPYTTGATTSAPWAASAAAGPYMPCWPAPATTPLAAAGTTAIPPLPPLSSCSGDDGPFSWTNLRVCARGPPTTAPIPDHLHGTNNNRTVAVTGASAEHVAGGAPATVAAGADFLCSGGFGPPFGFNPGGASLPGDSGGGRLRNPASDGGGSQISSVMGVSDAALTPVSAPAAAGEGAPGGMVAQAAGTANMGGGVPLPWSCGSTPLAASPGVTVSPLAQQLTAPLDVSAMSFGSQQLVYGTPQPPYATSPYSRCGSSKNTREPYDQEAGGGHGSGHSPPTSLPYQAVADVAGAPSSSSMFMLLPPAFDPTDPPPFSSPTTTDFSGASRWGGGMQAGPPAACAPDRFAAATRMGPGPGITVVHPDGITSGLAGQHTTLSFLGQQLPSPPSEQQAQRGGADTGTATDGVDVSFGARGEDDPLDDMLQNLLADGSTVMAGGSFDMRDLDALLGSAGSQP